MPCLAAVNSDDLRDWLLFAPIQPPHGPHRGGVAGWLDEAGRPAFVYGEITGYVLTCARFIARHHDGVPLRRRVDGAVAWLDAVWHDAPPPTRHYLGPAEPDWRNDAVFSFDGAMIVRGLSGLETAPARRTREAAENTLLALVAPDGTLRTHVPRANAATLPDRWSTTAGPFQLKTAAAILSAQTAAPLRAAAETTARRWIGWYPAHELTGELHPLLYHVEGLLLLGGALAEAAPRWRLAAEIFDEIMARQRSDGDLPSSFSDERAEPRSDVTAQALRIGTLLVQAGYLPGRRLRRLGGLADALRGYADPSGGVRFRRADSAPRHVNVWCTVFAYQALSLFERACEGAAIDERVLGTIA
ncbi:MAG TPA: hypothetical protein VK669_12965 [Candidatus Limnocylindrales bacterium]|nr:hypothetical protein [Candidatus Limnocylindrales bacterium]